MRRSSFVMHTASTGFTIHSDERRVTFFAEVVEWQTRTFEGRVAKAVRVQVPPSAPNIPQQRLTRRSERSPFLPMHEHRYVLMNVSPVIVFPGHRSYLAGFPLTIERSVRIRRPLHEGS